MNTRRLGTRIEAGQLHLKNSFIDAANIELLFEEQHVPEEPDLLCIDLDGNDYWVWKAITRYRPRVVAIEYNAGFGPTAEWIKSFDPI